MDSRTLTQLQETLRLLSDQVAQAVTPPVTATDEPTEEERQALQAERAQAEARRREEELDQKYEHMQLLFITALTVLTTSLWATSYLVWRGASLVAFITTLLLLFTGSFYAIDKFYLPGYSFVRRLREDPALLGKVVHAVLLSLGLIIAAATVSFPVAGGSPYAPASPTLPERGSRPDSNGVYNWPINIELSINGEPARATTGGAKSSGDGEPDRETGQSKRTTPRLQ